MVYKCSKRTTKANSCQYAYTQNATEQYNPNTTKIRYTWNNENNATFYDPNTSATSTFTKKKVATHYTTKETKDKNGKKVTKKVADKWKTVYGRPRVLACSDFHMEIPTGAYIYQVKFEARIRVDSNVDVLAPIGNFRIGTKLYGEKYDDTKKLSTGWNDGCYEVVPKKTKLTSKFKTYTYTIKEDDVQLAKYTAGGLNNIQMGIDFIWQDAEFKGDNGEGKVYVEWVRCTVEYDVPNYQLSITNPKDKSNTTSTSPYKIDTYKEFNLVVHCKNNAKAKGSNQNIIVAVPWGTELVSATPKQGTYTAETKTWTVPAKAGADYQLNLKLKAKKTDLSHLEVRNHLQPVSATTSASYYYFANKTVYDGYNNIIISPNMTLRKNTKSCINVLIFGNSSDTTVTVNLACDGSYTGGTWSLNADSSTEGVSLDSQTSTSATLTVPSEYTASLDYCFYPSNTGDYTFTVSSTDSSETDTFTFEVIEPYEYVLNLHGETADKLLIRTHRIASDVETDTTIIPITFDEVDSNMIMSECKLSMNVWEDLDYIGCVPLEHLHFDPKSTFKDTLLNSTYKNKRYMGKKLATDEDITLNVRLHPQQVTTIQGLIEMDKPIPINANHLCFEGDALNHRGWAEIYSIKAEKTNPHWYKCDIDVKYLTHNLNTRFKIDKGLKVSDYQIGSMMGEVHASGENLSDADSYFVTDTDGTFYYAEDYTEDDEVITFNDNERNNFSIDNGQHIRVTSRNPIAHTSIVSYSWSSVLIDEERENDVSRIIRLLDKNNKVVFEYEYDDIEFDDDEVTANVIYRVLDKTDTLVDAQKDITLRYSPNDVTLEDDDVDEETDSEITDVEETGEAHFGSTLRLSLENNKLSIVDMGFNGREIVVDDLPLVEGDYYYQVEWINNNDDAETSDIDCVFDFAVQETLLTSTYADKFGKLIISPFPVAHKKVLFTREAQEGTLYYYYDDGEEFSYLVEPYYQYMNGTDLVTNDGISIFNLNYGYEIVYIQNGLVRLGFNRLTGYLYLGKFDVQSQDYVTTHVLHLEKYDDINLNSISDDKIEIQASDSTFTIYRGHPYIKIKHELEDIWIDTVFNRVWAEQVGDDDGTELPAYWDLLNDKNLLDECVGGSNIKSSCIETDPVTHNSRTSTTLSFSDFPSDIETGDVKFTLSGTTLSEYTDEITLDGTQSSFGTYSVEIVSDGEPVRIDTSSPSNIIQVNENAEFFAHVTDSVYAGVSGETVYFYEKLEPNLTVHASEQIIQSTESTDLYSTVKDEDGSLAKNVKVYFYKRSD